MQNNDQSCANCHFARPVFRKFWGSDITPTESDQLDPSQRECHRFAPTAHSWPVLPCDAWCGEFKAIQVVSEPPGAPTGGHAAAGQVAQHAGADSRTKA